MSERELRGERDLTYSRWHRTESMKRFLPEGQAKACGMIDIDDCEYCRTCGETVALIETKRWGYVRQSERVTATLAARAQVPAFLVVYKPTETGDIEKFSVRQIHPPAPPVVMDPAEYAAWVYGLRARHSCAAVAS